MKSLGLAGDATFDSDTQDLIAEWLIKQTGGNVASLRGRWPSLDRVSDATINNAYAGTNPPGKVDPSPAQKAQTDLLKKQADARRGFSGKTAFHIACGRRA